MLVLGIESTCDETACAIVKDGVTILSNVVSSQIDLHEQFGGVVPELACRRHIDVMLPVIQQALEEAKVTLQEIDLIAVAKGPGLIGAILLGLNTAKTLSLALDKPFTGVNHVEAHLYAAIMSHTDAMSLFPCLGLVLSGGHTTLVLIREVGLYEPIAFTHDDAIGEAFDKVGKLLDLPYPGGPPIEALAKKGNPYKYPFKAGQIKNSPLDFSFSGLKTGVLYAIKGQNAEGISSLSEIDKQHIAASFQQAAFSDIIAKTLKAAALHGCQTIVFGGGVVNNQTLREMFVKADASMNYLWPSVGLSLDNAAMIAGLGYHTYRRRGSGDSLELEAMTRIPFDR
jgi:N6-L-threonylcarbamoyladenine synthase